MTEQQNEPVKAIPVEDEEGNFRLLLLSEVCWIGGEVEGDPESDAIFHADDGKKYKVIHSQKAADQFNEYLQKNKGNMPNIQIPGMRIVEEE